MRAQTTHTHNNKLTHTAAHTNALDARTDTQARTRTLTRSRAHRHARACTHTHARARTHALLGRLRAAGVTATRNITLAGSGPVALADRARGYPRTVTWLVDAPGPITVVFTQLDIAGSNGAYPNVP